MFYAIVIMTIFPAAMIYAALMDMFTMRIPNVISLVLVAAFAVLAPFSGLGWQEIGLHVGAGVLVFAVGFALFAAGWVGGGDVKFFAAVALWFGFSSLLELVFGATLLGGVLTLSVVAFRYFQLAPQISGVPWIERLHNKKNGVPYGIAIAGAALIIFPQTIWVSALH